MISIISIISYQSYHILSYNMIPYQSYQSYLILSYIMLYHISYHIISYHIISYHISYHIKTWIGGSNLTLRIALDYIYSRQSFAKHKKADVCNLLSFKAGLYFIDFPVVSNAICVNFKPVLLSGPHSLLGGSGRNFQSLPEAWYKP